MWSDIEQRGKSTAGMTLGLLGGFFGVIAGFIAILVGGAGLLIATEGGQIMWLGTIAVVFGITGMAGGAMTKNSPQLASILMIITGLAGFVTVSLFWLLPGGLLLVGAWFAWQSRSTAEPTSSELR